MGDQGLSEENTPAVAGPGGTGEAEQVAQPEVPWQQRYTDLQAEYTRSQQENAEMRRQQELYDLLVSTEDADTRRQVAERLGYQLEEEAQAAVPDPDNPLAVYDERIARLEQQATARQQAELEATHAADVRTRVDAQLEKLGIDRDDQDWVLAYAINALPPTQDGLPDVEQANQVFQAREDARQKAWAGTKRAPHISPNGQAATEVPNLDDRNERWAYMARRMNEGEPAT